jgi:prepilin-type N-terminal cleavage/methylation domain-containing protein
MKSQNNERGFNLVELMVAVSVIAILSTKATTSFRTVANNGLAVAQAKTIRKQIMAIREMQDKTLLDITESGCSACNCVSGGWGESGSSWSPRNPSCIAIHEAVWKKLGFQKIPKDPWGNVFMLEENEGEFGPDDCRRDQLLFYNPQRNAVQAFYIPALRCANDGTISGGYETSD